MAGCFFELCFERYALSDMMRTTYYPYRCRVLARRPKSCSNWRQLKSDLDKVPGSLKTISLGPTLQRPCTLQRHGATLFAKIQQRRPRPCSSCCAVGQVCTLPIIIDSLDSITRLLRHRVCSLQSATSTVLSQRLPLVTFIWRDVMTDASRGSLNLFRKNLMPVGLASIATSRLLNQCNANSPRQHSKCNSKCSQLKKWMNDPEFQTGPVFCLFNFNVWDCVSRANHGSVYPAVSLHGILFRRLMRELSGKLATFSDWRAQCAILVAREAWPEDPKVTPNGGSWNQILIKFQDLRRL